MEARQEVRYKSDGQQSRRRVFIRESEGGAGLAITDKSGGDDATGTCQYLLDHGRPAGTGRDRTDCFPIWNGDLCQWSKTFMAVAVRVVGHRDHQVCPAT